MKSVLISIRPKWCELIASGKKTIEVRKTKPKCDTPFKCYIYCTKPSKFHAISSHMATSDEYLHLCNGKITMSDGFEFFGRDDYCVLNGKVIGEFVCDKIISVDCDSVYPFDKETSQYINKESCLNRDDFCNYTNGKCAYGWHISDLKIYDKPRDLSEYSHICDGECDTCKYTKLEPFYQFDEPLYSCHNKITHQPQSWCYVN